MSSLSDANAFLISLPGAGAAELSRVGTKCSKEGQSQIERVQDIGCDRRLSGAGGSNVCLVEVGSAAGTKGELGDGTGSVRREGVGGAEGARLVVLSPQRISRAGRMSGGMSNGLGTLKASTWR